MMTGQRRIWRIGVPIGLLVVGLIARLVRLGWARHDWVVGLTSGETQNVARAFYESGRIADAFAVGQGPTAHVMPLPPIIAGTVYRIAGFETPLSEALLTGWSLITVFVAFWLLWKCFETLGTAYASRVMALAWLCLVPINFALETTIFKVWEGGLAAAVAAGYLLTILRLDRRATAELPHVAAAGALAAALLFISPPLGVAAYLCGALLIVRRVATRRRQVAGLVIVGVVSAVILAPWVIRNMVVMHRPILLRDNFGLELALANYPGAIANSDQQAEFTRHFNALHPTRRGYAPMVAAGGEAAYAQSLGNAAWRWIGSHPADFARLTLRHLTGFLFPPAWYFAPFGGTGMGNVIAGTGPKVVAMWLVSAFGLGGIVWRLWRGGDNFRYAAIMMLVPILRYGLVQPTLRYRYIVIGVLTFFAFDCLVRLWSACKALAFPTVDPVRP